jgi:hypothetical protein
MLVQDLFVRRIARGTASPNSSGGNIRTGGLVEGSLPELEIHG